MSAKTSDRVPGIPTLMKLDPDLKEHAKRAAKKKRMTLSEWTRDLMRKALADETRPA